MPRDFMASRERFYDRLDRQGTIEYTSGNDEFDDTVGRRWHAARPRELQFTDQYPKADIEADLAEIRRIENSENYLRERSPVSAMAENAIAEGLGRRGWLGPESSASITSTYDDIKSGADIVVTIPNARVGSVKFTVDVTVSEQAPILNKKIASELKRLARNDRTRLKYFRGVAEPVNRYVVAVPGQQVKAMADVVLNRSADPTVEYQLQLELVDELAYQAFRQADFTLRRYQLPGYQRAEDQGALQTFLEQHESRLEQQLPAAMADSVRVNRAVMEHMAVRKRAIRDEAAKKIGVTMLDRDSVAAPNVAHIMNFDPDQIFRRAA